MEQKLTPDLVKDQVGLVDLLARLGYRSVRASGKELFYLSMLRDNDTTPSFCVNSSLNVWYDHGTGCGGSVIDFEQLIRQMVDIIAASGMKDAGYTYIIIDDNLTGPRDSLGFLTVDKKRFPSGIKAMSNYIHSKGLKLGLYSDVGYRTCGGYIASRGHEFQDAIMFAKWGADYIKYDWCESSDINAIGAYTTMRDAIYATGRPMILSMCEWGDNKPWLWASDVGHLWRTTGDICNLWDANENHGSYIKNSIMHILDLQAGLRQYAGPGHWNVPDMLEVGNGKLTPE